MKKTISLSCKAGAMMLLVLCIVCSMVTPAFAVNMDLTLNKLSAALQISNSDISNYNKNYVAALPVEFSKDKNSYYVALGSGTANGAYGVGRKDAIYVDLVANALGVKLPGDYLGDETLVAQEVLSYIASCKAEIQKADLITYQLDAADFAMESMADTIKWETYVKDSATLQSMKNFRSEMTTELTKELGAKNAKTVAETLEGMLFQCVVYNTETIKAVKEIRKLNSDAVILVLGLYNPYRGLKATYQGSTFDISGWVDEVIKLSNVHLLKNTASMKSVKFVDVTGVKVKGFGSVTLTDDSTGAQQLAMKLIRDKESQYADAEGHKYLSQQIVKALAEPCKHSNTTVTGVKKATCKEAGYSGDTVCNDCKKVVKKGTATAKAAHTYGSWTQTKPASCSEKGEQYRVCSVCSYKDVQKIDKLAHTWNEGVVTKQPDCDDVGKKVVTCTVCKATSVQDIPALDHTWDAGTVTTNPGCDTPGVKTYKCTVSGCKGTKTEDVPASGHTFGDYVSNEDATCEKDGTKTSTCGTCGKSETVDDEGSKKPHDYVEGICSVCGAEKAKEEKKSSGGLLWILPVFALGGAAGVGGSVAFLKFYKKKEK